MTTPIKILGALLIGQLGVSLIALAVSSAYFPITTEKVDIARGEALFVEHCARCHALQGGQNSFGPSLENIGAKAADRVAGLSAQHYIFQSIVDPNAFRPPSVSGEMPQDLVRRLRPQDVVDMTAYLASQGGKVEYAGLLQLGGSYPKASASEKLRLELSSVEKGRQLFFSEKLGCAKCHALDRLPGSHLVAPDLNAVGAHGREYLKKHIRNPNAAINERYRDFALESNGRPIRGRILEQDQARIRLLTINNEGSLAVQVLAIDDLELLEEDEVALPIAASAMPDYGKQISSEDLDALVDFLMTLE